MVPKFGIDVSEHNGLIDWNKVKDSGKVSFAMLRAGYGKGVVDKQFRRNAAECNRLKIPIGVYWFSYAKNPGEAEQEANYCADIIRDYTITYPVAFDFEDDSVRNCNKAGIYIKDEDFATSLALNFLATITERGYFGVNYTNPNFISKYFDYSKLWQYQVWLAQWPNDSIESIEKKIRNDEYKPRQDAAFWQYSAIGNIPGINGFVDLDACYVEYGYTSNVVEVITKKEETEIEHSEEKIREIVKNAFNFEKQSSWAEKEIQKAIEMKISDGSRPYDFASRAEVMAMVVRAVKECKAEIEAIPDKIAEICRAEVMRAINESLEKK